METNITINEIRRINLRSLIEEADGKLLRSLSIKSGIKESYLSAILIRYKTESGGIRELGSKVARKLENACGKPEGWMDILHNAAQADPEEQVLRDLYLAMNKETRSVLIEQAKMLSKLSKK